APGAPAPEALLRGDDGQAFHLSSRLGQHFLVLAFNGLPEGPLPDGLRCLRIDPANDPHAQAWQRYGLSEPGQQALVLLRPDGYVMGRWHGLDGAVLPQALNTTGVSA